MSAPLVLSRLRVTSAEGHPLLHGLSLAVHPGTPVTVVGETGAGKSLLCHAIMGTLPAPLQAEGEVQLGDVLASALPARARAALWGRRVTMLPQEPWHALDPLMRAGNQVVEGHQCVRGRSRRAAVAAAQEDFASTSLVDAWDRLPHELSGGMAQRVAFCAARAGGAGILLADEPTKGLDADRRDAVAALLAAHAAEGCLLTITHDLALAQRLGGELIVLRGGREVERGPVARVTAAPAAAYTAELVAAQPDRWPRPVPAAPPAAADGAVLTAHGLAVARSGRCLVEDVDLAFAPGEMVGLAGPSGIGKSSLGDALLGLLRPAAGRVERRADLGRLRWQKIWQDPPAAFAAGVPLRTLLDDVRRRHGIARNRLDALLDAMGLAAALLERPAAAVSGGELQRIALARALLLEPAFLFADEPVSRLDPVTARRVVTCLRQAAAERGCSMLLVSHDHLLLQRSCDRVLSLQPPARGDGPARLVVQGG